MLACRRWSPYYRRHLLRSQATKRSWSGLLRAGFAPGHGTRSWSISRAADRVKCARETPPAPTKRLWRRFTIWISPSTYLTEPSPCRWLSCTFAAAVWLASKAGAWLRDRRGRSGEERNSEFDIILGATLTLLALIIQGSKRLDGGQPLRSARDLSRRLKPTPSALNMCAPISCRRRTPRPRARASAWRLSPSCASASSPAKTIPGLWKSGQQTNQSQSQLWAAVRDPAEAWRQRPPQFLTVGGMNDVLNSQGYTQAAYFGPNTDRGVGSDGGHRTVVAT